MPPDFGLGQLVHVHDDMYFGNSKDSIGLQLADLSSFHCQTPRRGHNYRRLLQDH